MRTQGSLRLILNTKLWAQMQMDKASEKSIRITATDAEDQGVKVFLISVSSGRLAWNTGSLLVTVLMSQSKDTNLPGQFPIAICTPCCPLYYTLHVEG